MQYFHQLYTADLVGRTSTNGSAGNLNQIISWRYSPTEGLHGASDTSDDYGTQAVRSTPLPVDRGIFRAYKRVITDDMQYDQPV